MYLHNIIIIEKAISKVISELKSKYLFNDSGYKYPNDSSDFKTIAIIKNNMIFYFWLSMKEGFELNIKLNTWNDGVSLGIGEFYSLFFKSWEDRKNYLSKHINVVNVEKYSIEWYDILIRFQISFIEQHFPTVFTEGDLSMFEK
jgi:hypothetical protein